MSGTAATSVARATVSRRALLAAIAGVTATVVTPLGWAEVVLAQAHAAGHGGPDQTLTFFSAADAADVEAIAAQIVPTDDSPGAREAGVIYFIDRALATFFSQLGKDYRAHLAVFQATHRERHPGVVAFATLTADEQVASLQAIEQTPFFNTTRLLTLLGLFSRPEYGGNRDGLGWALLGFEDRHVFHPPFGYYDRAYPGFAIDPVARR